MDRLDIDKLKLLPIEAVAERLGLTVSRHKALCPFHDDHSPSMTFKNGRFKCFVCGESGDVISLVRKVLQKDFLDACRWLSEEYQVIGSWLMVHGAGSDLKPETGNLKPKTFDASRYAHYFEHPWLNDKAQRFLFDERRIDARVVRWCRLTSWQDRQGVSWLQIPYYAQDGRLVGIQNRNLVKGSTPRFRFPQGSACGIYNLPVVNRLRRGDVLFIAEGASDCWSLLSAGHKAIAIPSATLLSRKDVQILETLNMELETRFEMFPDNDEPGEQLFLQLKEVLPGLVRHQLPEGCKDYSEYYLQLKK